MFFVLRVIALCCSNICTHKGYCLCIHLINAYSGDFPKITSIKGDKHIKTGETVNICCTATGEQPLKYTWWFSKVTPSASSSAVLPNEDGPTLVITDAKEKDHQGFYQCHVKNNFGQVTSDFVNIKVGELNNVDSCIIIYPFTNHWLTLAVYYRSAQSISKIGFALAKMVG